MHEDCYHQMYLNEEHHWWFKSKVDIVKELTHKFVGRDLKSLKVLDAGCGTSFLSKSIVSNLHNLYNVDNDQLSLYYSKKRGVVNIVQADLNIMPFSDNSFDLTFCMDVIEHNEDDRYLVGELSRVIKPGGIIIASVPALMQLWSPQDVKLDHFRRYKIKQFSELFEDKFEVLKASYCNTLLFPPIYLLRKIFNIFPNITKDKDELEINNKFINNILYKIFSQEAKLLKNINLPVGVSCIVVARKK